MGGIFGGRHWRLEPTVIVLELRFTGSGFHFNHLKGVSSHGLCLGTPLSMLLWENAKHRVNTMDREGHTRPSPVVSHACQAQTRNDLFGPFRAVLEIG